MEFAEQMIADGFEKLQIARVWNVIGRDFAGAAGPYSRPIIECVRENRTTIYDLAAQQQQQQQQDNEQFWV
jgi:hypothetical protein